jgi:hypothetical protein
MLRHVANDHGSRESSCAALEPSIVGGETGRVELQQPNASIPWAREGLRRMVRHFPYLARSSRRLPVPRQTGLPVRWRTGEEPRSAKAECRVQNAECSKRAGPRVLGCYGSAAYRRLLTRTSSPPSAPLFGRNSAACPGSGLGWQDFLPQQVGRAFERRVGTASGIARARGPSGRGPNRSQ